MDRAIGRLLARYQELGLADEAIVVFTADHGETMTGYDRFFRHGYQVWEPIMQVPLAVRRPGGSAARFDAPVSLADVVPTLLTYAGVPVPEGLDGMLLSRRDHATALSLEARDRNVKHRAMIRGSEKWFLSTDGEGAVVARAHVDLAELEEQLAPEGWPRGSGAGARSLAERGSRQGRPAPGVSERSAPQGPQGRTRPHRG